MKQDHRSTLDTENNPRDTVLQTRTHFPKATAQVFHQRLADRPAILHLQYIVTDDLPLTLGQRQQPITNRLGALFRLEENRVELPFDFAHMYQKLFAASTLPNC